MTITDTPTQLRVHGVGGPQARKMLGLLQETDLVTVPPFRPVDGDGEPEGIPVDGQTRFARRLPDDGVEAYEWGGLTTGSWGKALWVIYLPFTLINAGGWAHARGAPPRKGRWGVASHVALTHVIAFLATATYVTWIAYLGLDLVAVRWRQLGLLAYPSGFAHDAFDIGVPALALIAVVVVVVGLALPLLGRGRFERIGGGARAGWSRVPAIADREFFAHDVSHSHMLIAHGLLAGAIFVGAVVQWIVGWNRLGLVLIVIGVLQTGFLLLLGAVDLYGRWRHLWAPSGQQPDMPDVSTAGFRLPAGAGLATVGTVLSHSALSAVAMTLRTLLTRWPVPPEGLRPPPGREIPVRAELGAGNILAEAALIATVLVLLVVLVALTRRQNPVVALARQAVFIGALVAVATALPVLAYAWTNSLAVVRAPGSGAEQLVNWYDSYRVDTGGLSEWLGGKILLALPPIIWAVLAHPHDTGVARVIGNVWDVLTFWPRRFHPFAVPCTAERAVPELRSRVEWAVARGGEPVVVAHSQGSVLAAAALASAGPEVAAPTVRLVTFGSPIGSLYAPTWPAYMPPLADALAARVAAPAPGLPVVGELTVAAAVSGGGVVRFDIGFEVDDPTDAARRGWINFWRKTDPIGAGVPRALNVELEDPRVPSVDELDRAATMMPIERPLGRTQPGGHSSYLTDPRVHAAIAGTLRPDTAPTRPFRCWAHQGGAREGPSDTIEAMDRALGPPDPTCPRGGADALAVDVHLSSDGEVVVIHDSALDRTTDLTGPVARRTLAELAGADAAYWWVPGQGATVDHDGTDHPLRAADPRVQIPTLSQVLARYPDMALAIDVKRLRAAGPMVDALVDAGPRTEPVTVTARYGYRLGPVRRGLRGQATDRTESWIELAPGFSYLVWFWLRSVLRWPPGRSPYARLQIPKVVQVPGEGRLTWLPSPLRFHLEFATARLVAAAHDAGLRVDVGPVDDAASMAVLFDRGVDGILTDRPSVLAAARAARPDASTA